MEHLEELTTTQMAERVGVTVRTVQRWLKSGQLPAQPLPDGRYLVDGLALISLPLTLHSNGIKSPRRSTDELYDRYIDVRLEVEQLTERLAQAERRIERLTRQVADLTKAKGPAPKPGRRKKPTKWVPIDYVPCIDFARLHWVPISTVRQAIAEGRITVQTGAWKWGGRIIREMLDEEGCAQFYERFHAHPRFQACQDCPH